MMNNQKPRIWVSNANPTKGEIVKVRAVIVHRMEAGLRLNPEGQAVARNIINKFTASFKEQLLFTWEPETAISQNPYLEFTFVAKESGTLAMSWEDDAQKTFSSETEITIS